jgi:hypothetical protein
MWFVLKSSIAEMAPEKVSYSKYYEHDGALRAYANRAMVLAFLFALTAVIAITLAAYVRIQPPTVIRVDANGDAAIVGTKRPLVSVSQTAAEAEATDVEKRAFVHLFLERYLNFSPFNVSRNWADALNMMTTNLRRTALSQMQTDNRVGKIEDDQTRSEFHLKRLEPAKEMPLTYTAFGVKEVHHLHQDHSETSDKIVSEFRIRLVVEKRSEQNPSGLLIGEYWEQPIEGEKKDLVLREPSSDLSPQ